MRRRAFLFALLAGGLAVAGGVTFGNAATASHDLPATTTALARTELADVPAPTALASTRDSTGRAHESGRGFAVVLRVALAISLAGGWWLAREHAARVRVLLLLAGRRTRAPPRLPVTVCC
jgi:hypothetical protein